MFYLPELPTLIAFSAAVVLITLTPGPDMLLFMSRTMQGGRMAGLMAMCGAFTGLIVHTLLAAFGLSALLAASTTAFTIIKVAGAIYLAWLAYSTFRYGVVPEIKLEKTKKQGLINTYLTGLGINLLNPKIVVFFITFLPQFIHAGSANPRAELLSLGAIFILIALPISALLIIFADKVFAILKQSQTLKRAINWSFGTLMGAFAVKLLLVRAG
jgi:threonine/homoserine/homoserine lactone efflux protein